MPHISIDIDLDELDTDDLVLELISRDDLRTKELKLLIDYVNKLRNEQAEELVDKVKTSNSLLDKIKLELILENFDKKTLDEFEQFFNNS